MDKDLSPHGPTDIEVITYCTDGDNTCKVTYSLAPGKWPTADDIRHARDHSVSAAKKAGGKKWRLMTRQEYIREKFAEKTGVSNFAVPGGEFVEPK